MAGSLKNIGLTSLDDLFKTDEQRQADAQERVQIVPADQVFPYARQPYSIDRPTQDLAQLMDSIERVGITSICRSASGPCGKTGQGLEDGYFFGRVEQEAHLRCAVLASISRPPLAVLPATP